MHRPRKRFGQHFLCDRLVVDRIVDAIDPKQDEHVIEIGPGQGALTFPLLDKLNELDVIEFDRDLIPELESRKRHHHGDLIVHEADALTFDFASLKQDARMLRLAGNLPYNISTPLLFHVLSYAGIVSDMTFMLQKEVAERLAAKVGDDDYGRLSVMVQYRCQVELLFDVPPTAFYPPPKVQSSMVRLIPHPSLPFRAADETLFAAIVREAFGQRRKTLRNSLKHLVNDDVWSCSNIRSDARPETLSVREFVELANLMSKEA